MPKKGRAIGLGLLAVLAAAVLAMLTLGRDSLPALGRLFSPGPGILDDPAGLDRRDMPAVPVLLQKPELPAGCEATAAAMLLGAYGYAVSKEEMARAIPRAPFEKRDGRVYGPDPRDMYAGDPLFGGGVRGIRRPGGRGNAAGDRPGWAAARPFICWRLRTRERYWPPSTRDTPCASGRP